MSPISLGMWAFVAGGGAYETKEQSESNWSTRGRGWGESWGGRGPEATELDSERQAVRPDALQGLRPPTQPKPRTQHQAHPRDDPRPALIGQNATRGCGRPERERGI